MRAYIIRRVLLLIPTLLGITMVVFLTIQSIPGDPIEAYLGEFYEDDIPSLTFASAQGRTLFLNAKYTFGP